MARVCHIGLRQYRDMVKVSTPSSCLLRVRAQPGALSRVYPPPPDLPMQGPLGCPCFVVAPSDGGDGTRPAECATLRPVGDLPAATAAVLPEAIAVGGECVAPSARHLPTLLSRPTPAGLSDSTACRRPQCPLVWSKYSNSLSYGRLCPYHCSHFDLFSAPPSPHTQRHYGW